MGDSTKSDDDESGEEKSEEKKELSTEENKKEEKKDVENLRKVIKVDQKEDAEEAEEKNKDETKEEKKEDKKPETKSKPDPAPTESSGDLNKESLEQKRAILQNIKDFDFQIKKNHEDIDGINQRLDNLTKDLDDLVSLYEIVSEQMNPFVGISNVTKKRLDALENFTKEIDLLKERTAELESFAERSGAKLKKISEDEVSAETIDAEALLGKDESEEKSEEGIKEDDAEKIDEEIGEGEISPEATEKEMENTKDEDIAEYAPEIKAEEDVSEDESGQEPQIIEKDENIMYQNPEKTESITYVTEYLSDSEIDEIIENAFLSLDDQVDKIINEFIESLKG